MNGTIKTYLQEKGYGFIAGYDGKDYYFHNTSFKDREAIDTICENMTVSFDQKATPKGYRAINIIIENPIDEARYNVPNDVYISNENYVKGWDTLFVSDWIVHSSSYNSPDDAKSTMKMRAKSIGANCLINVSYNKTTGFTSGRGQGIYHYTIHNFSGRAINIGKKDYFGQYGECDFDDINQKAKLLQADLLRTKNNFMRYLIRIIAVVFAYILGIKTISDHNWLVYDKYIRK